MLKKRNPESGEKALARLPEAAVVPPRSGANSGLEAAFLAFLRSKAAPDSVVPLDRRIFLSLSESAELSGLPVSFLRRMIASGKLNAFRTGSGWRVPRSALEKLPDTLANAEEPLKELSEHEVRDIEINRLRRQGILPVANGRNEIT